jgi:hypothetical protein
MIYVFFFFQNLLSIFGKMEIIFRLTIIFAPTKHMKIPKSFYAETNGALNMQLFHYIVYAARWWSPTKFKVFLFFKNKIR